VVTQSDTKKRTVIYAYIIDTRNLSNTDTVYIIYFRNYDTKP
jgi:hypothetical protein